MPSRAIARANAAADSGRAGGSNTTCALGSVSQAPRKSSRSPRSKRSRASIARVACPQRGVDPARMRRRRETAVFVASGERDVVGRVQQERLRDLLRQRRAEPDRVGHAGVDRDAVVRDVRRQVEHVARPEHGVVRRREVREQLERTSGHERAVARPAPAPAAAPDALQQEDVVGVEVRADAAAGRRVARHQVVEARPGHEVEAAHQRVGARVDEVRPLHQQGPVSRGQRAEVARGGTGRARASSATARARRAATRRRRGRRARRATRGRTDR